MCSPLRLISIVLVANFLCAHVASASDAWYEIELIVFARNSSDELQSEEWPFDPGQPDWTEATPLFPDSLPIAPIETTLAEETQLAPTTATAPADTPIDANQPPVTQPGSAMESREQPPIPPETKEHSYINFIPLTLVPEQELELVRHVTRLENTQGMLETMLHVAWRQPVANKKRAKPVYISNKTDDGLNATAKVEGTVTVNLSRYLHLNLDLLMQNPALKQYGRESDFTSYRMQAHERMRSRELHYIDHPLMGVLVKITPATAPAPEVTEEPETPAEANQEGAEITPETASTEEVTPAPSDQEN